MSQLFKSSGYLENALSADLRLDFQSLPPFLRVLLTTDGTVTKSLESYFWEPVQVELVEQRYVQLEAPEAVIEKAVGDRVLKRLVELVGTNTGKRYVSATSLLCTELLEEGLRSRLELGRVGVGELLRDLGLETYREIISVGEDAGTSVWRLYRIVMNHRPFIQIRESFPIKTYTEL